MVTRAMVARMILLPMEMEMEMEMDMDMEMNRASVVAVPLEVSLKSS